MPTNSERASFPSRDSASDAPSMYERGPRRRSAEGIWSAHAPLWPADRTGVGPLYDDHLDASGEHRDGDGEVHGHADGEVHGQGEVYDGYQGRQRYEGTLNDGAAPRDPDGMGGLGMGPEDYERYGIGAEDENEDDLIELGSNATRNALEWAVVLVGAVLVALLLRASLFQAFWIPSESMEDTLEIEDRVLVNKLSYRLHEIHRGDVVVFTRPDDQPGEIRDLIKRIVGIPGDTIEGRDNTVYVNGAMLIEPYLDEGTFTDDFGPIVVPEGQVFVMGDNREESFDSRRFGTVAEDRVVGRAFVLFWPVNRAGWL